MQSSIFIRYCDILCIHYTTSQVLDWNSNLRALAFSFLSCSCWPTIIPVLPQILSLLLYDGHYIMRTTLPVDPPNFDCRVMLSSILLSHHSRPLSPHVTFRLHPQTHSHSRSCHCSRSDRFACADTTPIHGTAGKVFLGPEVANVGPVDYQHDQTSAPTSADGLLGPICYSKSQADFSIPSRPERPLVHDTIAIARLLSQIVSAREIEGLSACI
ncbi:hypothetical protein BD311DRAFT_156721 [Dichomitus squalens]|uniref:Uncharacterized protein n=1 Tax=Dichomitus squalens TaxID=114155 RepID=A0A4Q9M788_9APHY|nr:hypothetical protein BD311DRAFT_156721 [Dichomitus squalens]